MDYDRNIHHNPDADAWANFFVETTKDMDRQVFADADYMRAWFANAMMAMHDSMKPHEAKAEIKRLRETIANAAKLNARLMDIIHLAKRMKTAAFNHWCEKTPETNGILVDLQFDFEDALEGLKKDGYFSFRPSTKGE